jgi:hypothetical protein
MTCVLCTFSSAEHFFKMCSINVFLLVILFSAFSAAGIVHGLNFSLIAVLPNALSTAGLPYLGAPVELSVEDVNQRYSPETLHFNLSFVSAKKLGSCLDMKIEENRMVTEYYYKHHKSECTAIIGTSKYHAGP